MARRFRFGVQTGPFDDPVALREFARRVEDLGYDELFSYDHVGSVDPFLPLMSAAEATTRLRFGPLVINNELHNPVLLARTAATFDVLSGGRLTLGVGTGYMQSEHDASGVPLRPPGSRVTRLGESLAALRSLLDEGTATVEGVEIAIDVEDLGVRPAQERVPLLVGGNGRRVVTLAAKHADIFQFTGLTHDPETGAPSGGGFALGDVRQRRDWLAQSDRFDEIELSALVQMTHVGEGADRVLAGGAEQSGLSVDVLAETPFVLIGSLDQVVDKIHRLREDLGVSHFVIRDPEGFAPVAAAVAGS
jgi:probable F420-dependent oxidoreductase